MAGTNFDKKAYDLGITNCVFPLGKNECKSNNEHNNNDNNNNDNNGHYDSDVVICDDAGCGCFLDKLTEIVEYQIPSYYLDSTFDLGTPLSSQDGKTIFKEAVHSQYMECYYTISPQIEHQTENTCGSTSLVVALNALLIDPARATWYEQWRWHHLGSLACCTPRLQNPNMTLFQFSCLALCNDTLAFPVHVEDDWTLERVRHWVKLATSRSDVVMVTNYGRPALNQIGIGHFLPIAGYSESHDMVLLMDIAKHKYPAFWVPLRHLMGAMNDRDSNRDGDHRGFTLLTRPDYDPGKRLFGPSLLLRLDEYTGRVEPPLKSFMESWNKWLGTIIPATSSVQQILSRTIQEFISPITQQRFKPTVTFSMMDLTLVHFRCNRGNGNGSSSIIARCQKPHCSATCQNRLFCQQLQSLEIFNAVETCMKLLTDDERGRILDLVECELKDIDQATSYAKSEDNIRGGLMSTLAAFLKTEKLKTENGSGSSDSPSKSYAVQRINKLSKYEEDNTEKTDCPGYVEFLPEHILTFVFLAWPFNEKKIDSVPTFREYVHSDVVFDSTDKHCDASHVNDVLLEAFKADEKSVDKKEAKCFSGRILDLRISELVGDMKAAEVNLVNGFKDHENKVDECQITLCDVAVGNFLDAWITAQLLKTSNLKSLQHQVKAMKRKLNVILQYHKLLLQST